MTNTCSLITAIVRVRQGDREAYRLVVGQAEGAVRMVVAAILPPGHPGVDDVVQETFLVAWRKLGEVHDGERVLAWFTAIARNLALNERRNYLRERRRQDPAGADWIARLTMPETCRGMEAEIESALNQCLAGLGEQARDVITAHYWQDQDAEAISTTRQRPVGWARVVLCRARAAIAECLRTKGVLHVPN